MVWLVYLIRSFVCMDILGASDSEAFSIFVTVKVMKIRFMGFYVFFVWYNLYISRSVNE